MIVSTLRVLLESSQEFFTINVNLNLSTIKNESRSSLPYLPTFKTWEDYKSKSELMDLLRRKMLNIRDQIRSNIQNRLSNHETEILVVMTCLNRTVSFVTNLLTYISDPHQTVTDSNVYEEAS